MHSISDLVRQRAQHAPHRIAYQFFQGACALPETLTFHELWRQAAALGGVLQAEGLGGQRVLLVCKSQRHFVVAFFACLLAGAIAVPTAPPRRQSLLHRLQLIVDDAEVGAILFDCNELLDAPLASRGGALVALDLRSCLGAADVDALAAHCVASNEPIAFLQYTSGSTGAPKGVIVSHDNIIHNCAAIRNGMRISEQSSVLIALPLFHDMGLVGGVLQSMFTGCMTSFLSPSEFVQYPERWLNTIAEHRITISGGPNFMYELAARSVRDEDIAGIDLSHWTVAFCGAEPIRSSTVELFLRRFGGYGFAAGAFYPCYGMAEATLFITGAQVGAAPKVCRLTGQDVVGCGTPRHDTEVDIVDPATRLRVPEGCSGEIWVGGGSVAQGYWRRPEQNDMLFRARLADDPSRYFLRTGDLGYLRDGELYVAGRIKDLIIVNGRNYAPQDLEDAAERSNVALRQAGGAAFSVIENGDERVVIVFELNREWLRRDTEWPAIIKSIRAGITASLAITIHDVVLIKPGALPRTSSGKVRRSQCRTDYLNGTLSRANEPAIAPDSSTHS